MGRCQYHHFCTSSFFVQKCHLELFFIYSRFVFVLVWQKETGEKEVSKFGNIDSYCTVIAT